LLTFKEVQNEGGDLDAFRDLITEYQAFLGLDLCFQNFDKELANPLGKYTPPRGIVLLAYWDGELCACGAMQDLGDNVCELKRIYVKPDFRRKGIARAISKYLLQRAKEIGYTTAKLDTLKRLEGAVPLYQSLGFKETTPYNYNPEDDIVYMELPLKSLTSHHAEK